MAVVKDIIIYPIKGLGGIHLAECHVKFMGLEDDRRFMLIDEKGEFISQRSHIKMALISINIVGENIVANYKKESITFPKHPKLGELVKAKIWKHEVECNLVNPEACEWFSRILKSSVRLVKIPGPNSRIKTFDIEPRRSPVSFADGYPILIAGSASLDYLNGKLGEPISMDRFRANIIIDTAAPHEEDSYVGFSVGSSRLQAIKPCVRCQVISIDPKTAVKGVEPLKTLATYRRQGKGVCFGTNVIVLEEGRINIGDQLI